MKHGRGSAEVGVPAKQSTDLGILESQTVQALVDEIFVVDEKVWREKGQSDKFAFEVFRQLYGEDLEWDRCTIRGEPLLEAFRRVNETVHTRTRTEGGSQWLTQVAALQNGSFCVACGARSPLEVDHIVPVRRGGDPEHLENLQLLCKSCNSAKRDLSADLLPSVLVAASTKVVTPRMRFKRLQMSSIAEGNRVLGVCQCGKTSRETMLEVRPLRHMAANLMNLQVVCPSCKGMTYE